MTHQYGLPHQELTQLLGGYIARSEYLQKKKIFLFICLVAITNPRSILPKLRPMFPIIQKPATSLKVTLLHWVFFPRFLNCTIGTKSRKVSHMIVTMTLNVLIYFE